METMKRQTGSARNQPAIAESRLAAMPYSVRHQNEQFHGEEPHVVREPQAPLEDRDAQHQKQADLGDQVCCQENQNIPF